jgi:hypothetical protein
MLGKDTDMPLKARGVKKSYQCMTLLIGWHMSLYTTILQQIMSQALQCLFRH